MGLCQGGPASGCVSCQDVSVPGAGFTRLCFSHVMTLVANNCLSFSTVSFLTCRWSYQRLDTTGVTIHAAVYMYVCVYK